jgi:hypothetical protein
MTDAVTIACKLPNGLVLRLSAAGRRTGPRYVVKGSEGGYALTEGIPKDFWERWLRQNKDAPCVVKKLVFALPAR